METLEFQERIAQLGKGLVQANLRLARIGEALEKSSAKQSQHESKPALEALFDLVEALELALERRRPAHGLFGRRAARRDDDLWRGLALAHDAALERLAREGIEPVAREGKLDPLLHRVIEILPSRAPAVPGQLARTHRRGWMRATGGDPTVLRTAQVSVHGDREGER